jgi:serine-type D-Ala-D-Ala carboxypeptidase (penicillin-binding protein 5/6)
VARSPRRLCLLGTALAVLFLLVPGTAIAAPARPTPSPTAPMTTRTPHPLPTVDPHAPTPTAPWPGRPPVGSAPDGSTVGGERLATRSVTVAPGAPRLPVGLTAPAWLVADLGTGQVLAARDPHGRYYPASTLKTLTLLTLAPRLPASGVVTATDDDERIEGTRIGLVTGGRYPVPLLFRALILGSGNDVANALARANGGTAVTVAQMNATARRLGAFDTVAGTPSGLDVAGQTSSPYDLALIFRQLLADPLTAGVLRTPRIQIPPAAGRPGFEVDNEDPLLGDYPGDLGGKNGFTDAARHTFVTAARRGGQLLVVSIMGSERRPVSEYDQAARLLDWGFAVPAGSTGVGRLVDPGDVATDAPLTSSDPPSSTRAGAASSGGSGGAGSRSLTQAAWPMAGVAGLAAAIVAGIALGTARRRRRR